MTSLATPVSVGSVPVKKVVAPTTISTNTPRSATMENATTGLPHASPSSSASASFPSSSASSSPSSSTLSLPPSTLICGDDGLNTAEIKGKGKAVAETEILAHSQEKGKGKGKGIDTAVALDHDDIGAASAQSYSSHPKIYTHSNTQSSNSSSVTSLSSAEDKAQRATGSNGKGTASQSGSGSSLTRMASSSAHYSYLNGVGSSSSSGSGSSSGPSSKPVLNRSTTAPVALQQPLLTSTASTLASAAPQEDILSEQDLALLGYDALPADFDFGDLPFYDTDPRTGIIYGDPRAIILPYLVPEQYFDLYRLAHDAEDPRKTNFFNKYGGLIYYHPGRHIGQEQDSLRSNASNQPIWTVTGRTSTWGTLTATEMGSKRQIKIVMESNKKKAAVESSEPLARFVFRWKDDDFVTEYRKQKDQYRITTLQMCGGESKWKPPQPRPTQTMFHGIGMDAPGNPYGAHTIGTPSPFDPTRYLQLISEYRLNSGPVVKDGDLELYNPDTFPPEFRTFLMLISITVLDMMRPVDDKTFYKAFPAAALIKSKVPSVGGLHIAGGPLMNGRPLLMGTVVVGKEDSCSLSSSSLNADGSSTKSASVKAAAAVSTIDVASVVVASPKTTLRTRSTTLATSTPASTPSAAATSLPKKKSRWASFFSKK